MKAMCAGFAAVAIIGVAAWYALDQIGFTSQAVNSGENVRID